MHFRFAKNTVYDYSHIEEMYRQKPIFLGYNGITGKFDKKGFWKFNSNPAICITNVCDNKSLDDIVILFLHVRMYNADYYSTYRKSASPAKSMDTLQIINSIALGRVAKELVHETSIEVETILSAYNLMLVMNDSILNFYHRYYSMKSVQKLEKNLTKISDLKAMLCKDSPWKNEKINLAVKMLLAGCSNLRHTLMDAISIIKNNDSKTIRAELVTDSNEVKFLSDGKIEGTKDPYFKEPLFLVTIVNDIIDIFEYTISADIHYLNLQNKLRHRASNVKTLKHYDMDSVPLSILTANIKKFRKIVKQFIKHFWKLRSKTKKQKKTFKPRKTRFIFKFTTLVLNCLKIIPKEHPEHEKLLHENLLEFCNILNSLRFSEIDDTISLRTSATLSKTLDELVESPSVENIIEGMPAKIKLVITRITSFVGIVEEDLLHNFMSVINELPSFSFIDVKPIRDLESVSILRRSEWIDIFASHVASDGGVHFYNQDACPVCFNEQKKDDSCVLICKHSLCSSCMETICDKNKTRHCPVCRSPVREFLQSHKIEEICQNSQQYLSKGKEL